MKVFTSVLNTCYASTLKLYKKCASSDIARYIYTVHQKTKRTYLQWKKHLLWLYTKIKLLMFWSGNHMITMIYLYTINNFLLSWFLKKPTIEKYTGILAQTSNVIDTTVWNKIGIFVTSQIGLSFSWFTHLNSATTMYIRVLSEKYEKVADIIFYVFLCFQCMGMGLVNSATALKNKFRISEEGIFNNPLVFLELIAADLLHITPLVWLVTYGFLALPESYLLLAFTAAFVILYRVLLIVNTIFSGTAMPDEPVIKHSELIDAFTPKKNMQILSSKFRIFFPRLYSKDTWRYLIQTTIDSYSEVLGLPIEDYPLLARGYKGIHMVITAPFILMDCILILSQNRMRVASAFTHSIEGIKKSFMDFGIIVDYRLPVSFSLGFCPVEAPVLPMTCSVRGSQVS